MTLARIQQRLRKLGIELGQYNGKNCARIVVERNKALFLHNNHFCSIWKSGGVSFNQAVKELKVNL